MSTEFDPLDELFTQPAKSARAGGKFAPKVKPRLRTETSIKLPPSQPVQNIKITDSETEKRTENSFDSRVHSLSNSSLANSSSEHSIGGTLDNSGLQTDVADIHRKPSGEEASMNTDVDPLDEIFSAHVVKNARGGANVPLKTKPHPWKETSIYQPSVQPVNRDTGNGTKKALENKSNNNLALQVDVVRPDISGELTHENVDAVVGSESFDDVSYQTTIPTGSVVSTEIDPLDELFTQPAKSARAGGKYAPKVKARPRKETSIKLHSSQPVQNIKSANSETEKPSENNFDSGVHSLSTSFLANSSSEHSIGGTLDDLGLQTDVVPPNIYGKPIGEEASTNADVDPLDDIFSGHVAKNAKGGAKFPPKIKPRPRKETSIKQPTSQPVHWVAGNEIKKATDNKPEKNLELQVDVVRPDINGELAQENADTVVGSKSFGGISDQATMSTEGSVICQSNVSSVQTCIEDRIPLDATPRDEEVVSDSNAGFHFNDGVLEIEEIETGPCTEGLESIFDMTTQSGQRSRKIQPTPKFQVDARNNDAINSDLDESQFLSCFENDDYVSEFLPHEGLTGHAETLEKSTELRERRKISTVCDDSLGYEEASTSGQDNEPNIYIKKLRKRINSSTLVDENEDEAHDVGNLGAEHPSGSPLEKENCNDVGNEVQNETQTEKKSKRSRKASSQKEKPVRKRKKVNEASDQEAQKPRKKFSHSTRRTKRQVDKVLLETPEDDIDMTKLRIRDLILLGEHREKAMSKEGKITEPPSADKSADTSFDYNDDYTEDQDFSPEGGQFSNDEPQNSNCFNYHSHMKKTPRSRWSKQDTELFYEGVRQFGSDISMVQQLFPDRTRAQVKLKYKKEERQQPLRLHDALTGRSEDHSHFLRVIEQLKQLSAQENHNSFDDDPVDVPGNEEVTPGVNEKVDNLEKMEERENEGVEPDPSEAQSPLKSSYDSDDDLDTWFEYKSDL